MFRKFPAVVLALTISVAFVYADIARAEVVKDGLVSYWTFDEGTVKGETLSDVHGSNDGTISGDPEIVPGKIGEALKFDGDDYIDFGNDPSVILSDTDLSVALWFNAETVGPGLSDNTGYLVGTYSSDNGKYYQLFVENGTIALSIDDNVTKTQINSPINAGEWYYVVGVRESGKEIRIYLNGELAISADDLTAGDIASDAPLYAGNRFAGERAFKGLIDEVGIYSRALSAGDIQKNYSSDGFAIEPAGKLSGMWGEIKSSL